MEKTISFRLAGFDGLSLSTSFFPDSGRSVPAGTVVVVVVARGRVVVVARSVVVVVGSVHAPKLPVTSAPSSGPLLVGVGQARAKSLLAFVCRTRLWTPSPGVAVAGESASVFCGPAYGP